MKAAAEQKPEKKAWKSAVVPQWACPSACSQGWWRCSCLSPSVEAGSSRWWWWPPAPQRSSGFLHRWLWCPVWCKQSEDNRGQSDERSTAKTLLLQKAERWVSVSSACVCPTAAASHGSTASHLLRSSLNLPTVSARRQWNVSHKNKTNTRAENHEHLTMEDED